MRDFISKKIRGIAPSGIRKYFDIVSEMKDAISLGVGEPDFGTPWEISEAGIRSVQKGFTHYTSNKGMPKLREAISHYLSSRYKVHYDKEEIVVTVGASEAIDITLRAVCDPGDEVLIPMPSYVSYAPCVSMAGGVPVGVECNESNGFILTKEMLQSAVTPKSKAIILPYPNNPTGAIMTRRQLEDIRQVIEENDLLVISDEIYSELTYDGKHVSIASLDGMRDRTVLLNGFSKAFAMTGWRIGYACAPRDILDQILKVHQYTIMCAPTMAQHAAIAALETGRESGYEAIEEMRTEYDCRRRYLLHEFNGMGLHCFEAKGAFYLFPSVASTGMNGEEFANALLKAEKVAVVPGSAFGRGGENHIRVSYAYSLEELEAAVKRIKKFLNITEEL
ncbi:MAG TPA: aminotransferase class I/II-fold pyridoxal phosphate-dependent enzyme [Firmicutes bacterium]|nr:aminotransferase class I/II-fold pyridoxal phosphate-dependent enzyme [Bacillota bacterium]